MKSSILIILSLSALLANAQNWQEFNPRPTTNNLFSVYFLDSNSGFAVGELGTILNTSNGGLTWNVQFSAPATTLNSVLFINSTTGFITGGGFLNTPGYIMKTTDSGLTWRTLGMGTIDPLYSVSFTGQDTGFCVGLYGSIFKTTNAGEGWANYPVDSINFLWSVHFPDRNTGYAVGMAWGSDGGTIFKTSDCGSSWNHLGWTSKKLFSVYFLNKDTGIIVGEHGTILRTIDGGTSWNIQPSNLSYPYLLLSVYFPTSTVGYAVGESGTILKSIDGGSTWNSQVSGTNKDLYSVFFTDLNTGYAVGDSGTILKTTNGGNYINEQNLTDHLKIFPNPVLDNLTIELAGTEQTGNLTILTLDGKEVIGKQISNSITQLDISNLANGIYFLRYMNDKNIEIKKLIKE